MVRTSVSAFSWGIPSSDAARGLGPCRVLLLAGRQDRRKDAVVLVGPGVAGLAVAVGVQVMWVLGWAALGQEELLDGLPGQEVGAADGRGTGGFRRHRRRGGMVRPAAGHALFQLGQGCRVLH